MDLEIICTPETLSNIGLGVAILCSFVLFLMSKMPATVDYNNQSYDKITTRVFFFAVVGCLCGFVLFIYESIKEMEVKTCEELVSINQSIVDFQESTNKAPDYLDKNANLLIERTIQKADKQITTSIYVKDFNKKYNSISLYVVRKETSSPEGENVEYKTYRKDTREVPQEIVNLTKRLEQKDE